MCCFLLTILNLINIFLEINLHYFFFSTRRCIFQKRDFPFFFTRSTLSNLSLLFILIYFIEICFAVSNILTCGPRQLSRHNDSLRVGRYGNRIPMKAIFSEPFKTVLGAHPISNTMDRGSVSGVESDLGGVLTTHPNSRRD